MASAVFLVELATTRDQRGRGGTVLAIPCMAELEGTTWTRRELPAGGWVLTVEGDEAALARIAAVPGVVRVGAGGDPQPGDRAAVVAWLRRRGVTRSAAQLAQAGGLAAALDAVSALERRAPRVGANGAVTWDGPALAAREAPRKRPGKAAR